MRNLGINIFLLGYFIDRIVFHCYLLPSRGKASTTFININELFDVYQNPISWIGLSLMIVAIIILINKK